ncbi:MAG TPA: hypothetical protein VN695_16520 [Streptosporangiaceae bacterium]|nr:hypothetical protein [Streptosporangiaceae bacterium]
MTAAAIGFIVIALILCAGAVFCSLGIGQIALSGSDAIERDGLARGQRAPRWSLTDSAGRVRTSPSAGGLQLIVFADHSLKSFPSVIAGLRELNDVGDVEIVILTRGSGDGAEALIGELGLGRISVVAGSAAIYGRYNVRVMPFAIFVDSAGLVRASSLVNHDWQIAKLRQVAEIDLEPDELPGRPRALFTSAV